MVRLFTGDVVGSFISSNFFVNLDGPVGLGQANKREDVMFVQFLLHVTRGDFRSPTLGVKRDGFFGGETKVAIEDFQRNTNSTFGAGLKEDGIIHPIKPPGTGVRSSTLGFLTQIYISRNRETYPDFRGHPDWPGLSPLGITLV